jgi:hypothetical protein
MSIVKQATPGNGFDVDSPLSTDQAKDFVAAGYSFCVRYLPRTSGLVKGNLTMAEIVAIMDGGLALMAVQHVAPDNWQPNAALGQQYGQYAGQYASEIGLPNGMNIWLDLEMVAPGSDQDVIDYCHNWFEQVKSHGYIPGLYVGWQTNLSDQQLYDLPFENYWKGYNCDQSIPTRGWQILQHPQKTLNSIPFDPNTLQADLKGSLPMWLSPA